MKKTSQAVVSFDYGTGACSEAIDESACPLYDPLPFAVGDADPMLPFDPMRWRPHHAAGPEAIGGGGAGAA
jgi:hypothetical protein